MKNTNPENSKQHGPRMDQITRQRGFFSIGVGLGLSAIFALFSAVLEPEKTLHEANNQTVVQEGTTYAQNTFVPIDAYPGRHQF